MSEYRLEARQARIGEGVSIGVRAHLSAISGEAESIFIGDNVFIGDDVRILAPRVRIGDYTIIHHHTTIYGYDDVVIGDCTWVGQGAILNCTAPLTIGRGCTISAMSNIWTHFSGGDPVAGCNFNSRKAANLGDDAWIGVQASIAPVSIGSKALVLAGSVVTGDIPANRVYGGNPASDLTDKLGAPYSERPAEDKFADMCLLLREYHEQLKRVATISSSLGDAEFMHAQDEGRLCLGGITIAIVDTPPDGTSVFDVRDRTYSKLRTPEEIGFMNFILPLVKFYPREINGD
jgi:acetyltransferase-like isoleucine patch superfamily enzyme